MSKNEKEPLFSAKNMKYLTGPFSANNPVIVQILGICSALAVTVQLKPAIVMALSVTVVTAFSNLVMSLLRNGVPARIRIIVQLVVIAALVILVDQVLKAYVYEISKQLSVYVGLIITNCIVMGRVEAFALGNKPWASFLDGIGNGLGYGLILVIVAFFRELFGSGSLLGFRVIPESWYITEGGFYSNCGLMLFPPMALIIVGCIIWVHRSRNKDLQEKYEIAYGIIEYLYPVDLRRQHGLRLLLRHVLLHRRVEERQDGPRPRRRRHLRDGDDRAAELPLV